MYHEPIVPEAWIARLWRSYTRKDEDYAKSRNRYGQRLRHESDEQGSRYA